MLCILHLLLLSPVAGSFWGPNALVSPSSLGLNNLWSVIWLDKYFWLPLTVFGLSIILSALLPKNRWLPILIWFLGLNIYYRPAYMNTSGDNLTVIFLFFNMFIQLNKQESTLTKQLNKWTLIGLQGQMCVIYLISAIYKWGSSDWTHGTAVMQSLQVAPFGYVSALTAEKLKIVFMFMTYATLIYQTMFLALVWHSGTKKWMLLIGVIMHLGIILSFGLVEFGLTMIVGYTVFIPDSWTQKLSVPIRKYIKT